MSPDGIRQQIVEFINRLVSASISVKQFYPSMRKATNGSILIGLRQNNSISLHDIPYGDIYRDIELNNNYDIKLVDGGLLIFQYHFDCSGTLLQHRLAYFPSPVLPTIEEAPELYERDELYGDIITRRLIRFPIRFDYSPAQRSDVNHPAAHMTLGQYENCRIPVAGPLAPNSFGMFIIRNFYHQAYIKHKNIFDRHMLSVGRIETISDAERRISHMVHGR